MATQATGPEYVDTIITSARLSATQAQTAARALRAYQEHVESRECNAWPANVRAEVSDAIAVALKAVDGGGGCTLSSAQALTTLWALRHSAQAVADVSRAIETGS